MSIFFQTNCVEIVPVHNNDIKDIYDDNERKNNR